MKLPNVACFVAFCRNQTPLQCGWIWLFPLRLNINITFLTVPRLAFFKLRNKPRISCNIISPSRGSSGPPNVIVEKKKEIRRRRRSCLRIGRRAVICSNNGFYLNIARLPASAQYQQGLAQVEVCYELSARTGGARLIPAICPSISIHSAMCCCLLRRVSEC